MTFKDITIKNFNANIRRYMSYFYCSSFSVMLFFMYTTILYNNNLNKSNLIAPDAIVALAVPSVALIVFSVVFINYAHSSFIKSRQREFGLFLSLGMSLKQIMRIIIFENALVGIASMTAGIITGAVFSRLFFLVILKVLQVSGITFYIPYKSYILTFGIFSMIFIMAILTSMLVAWRFQPVQLLKSSKLSQRNKVSNPFLALVGICIVAGCIVLLCIAFASEEGVGSATLFITTGVCLTGLYISISQLGGFILKLVKKKKSIYYRNLRLMTALDYRFRQTKKIIFVTAVMVMVTTFFCGEVAYFLGTADSDAEENVPYHISYIQYHAKNNLPEETLNKIFTVGDAGLKEHKVLEVLNAICTIRGKQWIAPIKAISVDALNRACGGSLQVNKGNYIRLEQFKGRNDNVREQDKGDIGFKFGGKQINLKYQQLERTVYFSRFKNFAFDIILLNDEDYEALVDSINNSSSDKNAAQSHMVYIHMVDFNDWHKTLPTIQKLKEEFKAYNKQRASNPFEISFKNIKEEEEFFNPESRIEYYTSQKQSASVILFVSGFLGLFFFIASSVILSFKVFSEIDDEKTKYKQFSSIGISYKEIKKTINEELGVIFFTPVLLGTVLSFLYIYAFTRDGGNNSGALSYNLLASSIYLVFQIGYYFIIRKVYSHRIVESV